MLRACGSVVTADIPSITSTVVGQRGIPSLLTGCVLGARISGVGQHVCVVKIGRCTKIGTWTSVGRACEYNQISSSSSFACPPVQQLGLVSRKAITLSSTTQALFPDCGPPPFPGTM